MVDVLDGKIFGEGGNYDGFPALHRDLRQFSGPAVALRIEEPGPVSEGLAEGLDAPMAGNAHGADEARYRNRAKKDPDSEGSQRRSEQSPNAGPIPMAGGY